MKCAQCGKTTLLYLWISENLRFCCFDCFDTYQGKEEVMDMTCDRCRTTLHRGDFRHQSFSQLICHSCFSSEGVEVKSSFYSEEDTDAYQGKENAMEYLGHTVTAKMYITPPNGARETFNLPLDYDGWEAFARNEVDKMIPEVRCAHCKIVIEPGALYVDARLSIKRFCSIQCYDATYPHRDGVPELKRLDSAPKAE